MNFDELSAIINAETDIPVCPVCGTPFRKSHKRQKTCGSDECKKEWKSIYQKSRVKRLREEDEEAFRKYHADAQRKSRDKKRRERGLQKSYKVIEDYWNREVNENIYGLDYGKRQAERTLAAVPKIDVRMKGENDDRVQSIDEQRGSK